MAVTAPPDQASQEQLLDWYRTMRTIREFEERLHKEFATGEIPGFVHLYAGEEAIATGVCAHLRPDDYIASTHRGHGHAIAKAIQLGSDDVLQVEQGSLYPALHRLIKRGWITFDEGPSENNRRAKFYRLTPKGRKQLAVETSRWERLARAMAGVLRRA